uniref:Colipase like 1 n=1 Tax=Felis catus TaxID=9685 RepID=A0ABI8A3M6_FELCA
GGAPGWLRLSRVLTAQRLEPALDFRSPSLSLCPSPARALSLSLKNKYNKKCKSGCCRRETEGCESHCQPPRSRSKSCLSQTFLGLYNECPRLPNLTCVFPKNETSFNIIYGRCKKIEKRKSAKNIFF